MGQNLKGVAGDDRRCDAEYGPHRRAVMPFGVDIDDVVMDE